jgi:hypothetical protein
VRPGFHRPDPFRIRHLGRAWRARSRPTGLATRTRCWRAECQGRLRFGSPVRGIPAIPAGSGGKVLKRAHFCRFRGYSGYSIPEGQSLTCAEPRASCGLSRVRARLRNGWHGRGFRRVFKALCAPKAFYPLFQVGMVGMGLRSIVLCGQSPGPMAAARSTWPNKQRGGYSPRWVLRGWGSGSLGDSAGASGCADRPGGSMGAIRTVPGRAAGSSSEPSPPIQCFQALSALAVAVLARRFSPRAQEARKTAIGRLIACFATLAAQLLDLVQLAGRADRAEGGVVPPSGFAIAPHARRGRDAGDPENPAPAAPCAADRGSRAGRMAKIRRRPTGSGVRGASGAANFGLKSAVFREKSTARGRGRGLSVGRVHDLLDGANPTRLGGVRA